MSGVTRSLIISTGSYLPGRIVTNHDLATRLDTSDEWIVERSGIRHRHIAAEGELTSDLGTAAAAAALREAGVAAPDVDLVIVATATPDQTFPSTATRVQHNLGIGAHAAAFDVAAVCSGFLYALTVADAMLRAGHGRHALVIGAETFSRIVDWDDRTTCVLFGDGAGAVLLRRDIGQGTNADRGILGARLHSDGQYNDALYVDGGAGSTRTVGKLRMKGREVFRHAVNKLSDVTLEVLEMTGLSSDDVDWVVPHQANLRIINGVTRKLNIDPARVVTTVEEHANTSAASIPLALDKLAHTGDLKAGDLLLLDAMGGGFTWGAAAVRW